MWRGQKDMSLEQCSWKWIWNLCFGRWAGCRWCPGWRRWRGGKLCCCPSLDRQDGTWKQTSMMVAEVDEVVNLMAVVGELWSTRVCKDLARTTATSRRSISRNVKNPSVRLWRENRWGRGKSFVLWRNQFHIHLKERPFLIHLWRKPWPRVGAGGPSLIRDLTWLFTEWLFISGTRQACLCRGVQLKSRPNRTNCLIVNVWYVHIMAHAKYEWISLTETFL